MDDLAAIVKRHNEAVRTTPESRVRYRQDCPICHCDRCSPHELRRRSLRVIQGNCVLVMAFWLARWRCADCRRIWTDYPPFRAAA